MTALEAIRWIDEKKHNTASSEDKLVWLSQLEGMVQQLHSRHGSCPEAGGLTLESRLAVPEPYDSLYLRWLEAQIDYTNQEYARYNNAMTLFNTLWSEYANRVNRERVPASGGFRIYGGGCL